MLPPQAVFFTLLLYQVALELTRFLASFEAQPIGLAHLISRVLRMTIKASGMIVAIILDAVQGVHDALQDIDASTSNVGITLAVLDQCAYFCTSVGELSVDVVDSHLRAPPRDLELQ